MFSLLGASYIHVFSLPAEVGGEVVRLLRHQVFTQFEWVGTLTQAATTEIIYVVFLQVNMLMLSIFKLQAFFFLQQFHTSGTCILVVNLHMTECIYKSCLGDIS